MKWSAAGLLLVLACSAQAATRIECDILSPTGGEVFVAGQKQYVKIGLLSSVRTVSVSLSIDNGDTWPIVLTAVIDNTGPNRKPIQTIEFVVPAVDSKTCRIRAIGTTVKGPRTAISGAFVIGTPTLLANTVTNTQIADGSVTNPKLAEGAVSDNKITSAVGGPGGSSANTNFVLTADGTNKALWRDPNTLGIVAPPGGVAGGDLTGTYPSPLIANNAVTPAKIALGAVTERGIAATALSTNGGLSGGDGTKLAVNTDRSLSVIGNNVGITNNAVDGIQLANTITSDTRVQSWTFPASYINPGLNFSFEYPLIANSVALLEVTKGTAPALPVMTLLADGNLSIAGGVDATSGGATSHFTNIDTTTITAGASNLGVTSVASLNVSNGGITNAGNITGVGTNITGNGAVTLASSAGSVLTLAGGTGVSLRPGTGVVSAYGDVVPDTDNARDLGQGALRWRNLFLAGSFTTSGTLTATGGLDFLGARILGSNALTFDGSTAGDGITTTFTITNPTGVSKQITFPNLTGSVILDTDLLDPGRAANQQLSNLGTTAVNTNLLPDVTANARSLGSTTNRWGDLYARSADFSGNATIANGLAVTGTTTVAGSFAQTGGAAVSFSGPVTSSGMLTANGGASVTGNETITGSLSVNNGVSIGAAGNTGSLSLRHTSGSITSLSPAASVGNVNLTLPGSIGLPNQFLQTDGVTGALGWASVSGMLPSPASDKSSLRYNGTIAQWVENTKVLQDGTGSIELIPPTAGNGSLIFKAINNSPGIATTIQNAAQTSSQIYSIPDTQHDADFVMSWGNQVINGAKQFNNLVMGAALDMNNQNIVNVGPNINGFGALTVQAANNANTTLNAQGTGSAIVNSALGGNVLLQTGNATRVAVTTANTTVNNLLIAGAGVQTSTIGSGAGDLTLNSAANLVLNPTGNVTVKAGGTLAGLGALTISSGAGTALTLNSADGNLLIPTSFTAGNANVANLVASGSVTLGDTAADVFQVTSQTFNMSGGGLALGRANTTSGSTKFYNSGNAFAGTLQATTVDTSDKTYELPNKSGTIMLTSDFPANNTLDATIRGTGTTWVQNTGLLVDAAGNITSTGGTFRSIGAMSLAAGASVSIASSGGATVDLAAKTALGATLSSISLGNNTITTAGHLLPTADNTYDLGNGTAAWRDLNIGRNLYADGLLYAGTPNIQLTDATGHILSAALNTVQPAQGGTGVTTAPTAGQILVGTAGNLYAPASVSGDATLAAGGALTVGRVNGASAQAIGGGLTTGNVLQVINGATVLGYAPVNLAGGANFITGVLPVANGGSGGLTLNGVVLGGGAGASTATAVGAAGQVLRGTGAAPAWGAVNLAMPGGDVTGVLGIANGGVGTGALNTVLIGQGVGTPSVYGQLSLTAGVTGVLPIANGGTGIAAAPTVAGEYLRSSGAGTWAVGTIAVADVPNLSGLYVDLTTGQTVAGGKTFSNQIVANAGMGVAAGQSITGAGALTVASGGGAGLTLTAANNTLALNATAIQAAGALNITTTGAGGVLGLSSTGGSNITLSPASGTVRLTSAPGVIEGAGQLTVQTTATNSDLVLRGGNGVAGTDGNVSISAYTGAAVGGTLTLAKGGGANLQSAGATNVTLTAGSGIVSVAGTTVQGTGALTVTSANNANLGLIAPGTGVVNITGSTVNLNSPLGANLNLGGNSITGALNITATGTVTAGTLSGTHTGNGAALTGLDAANIAVGTLPVARGGTGAGTQQAAMNSLAGAVTNQRYLRGDGTNVTMSALATGDLVGQVAVANGGTGVATAANNVVFAGPNGGGPLAPTFRALALADLPSLAGVGGYVQLHPGASAQNDNVNDANPSIWVNKANGAGTLMNVQYGGLNRFVLDNTGATTMAGALTVSGGGASITGGLNNNTGNITNAGSITGVGTNITATGNVTISGGTAATNAVNIITGAGSNGNIVLTPNGTGAINLVGATNVTGAITATGNLDLDGTITAGSGAGTVLTNATGTLRGQAIEPLSVANGALANSAVTVTAGTNLSGGGAVSLGAATTLNVVANPNFATSVTTPLVSATTSVTTPTVTNTAALTLVAGSGAGANNVVVTPGATGALVASTNATYDIGVNATRWRDLYLSGSATIGGNATVTGTITAGTFSGALAVGNLTGTLPVTSGGTGLNAIGIDNILYTSAANTLAATGITAYGRGLINVANAAAGRTNLGLGTMATQDATAVAITGGSINGTTIGAGTASTGVFTTATATQVVFPTGGTNATISAAAQAANRAYSIPDAGVNASFVMTEGVQTINGAKTFGSTITGNISGTAGNVTGTVGVANGGTGVVSPAAGTLLIGNGAAAMGQLADVALGNVLLSGGVGSAPAYGKVDLTAHVTGVLPLANGGTGSNTQNFVDLSTVQAAIGGAKTFTALLTGSAGVSTTTATATTSVTTPLVTNAGALNVQTTGANTLTLTSGSNTVSVAATSLVGTGALTLASTGGANGVTIDSGSGVTSFAGDSINNINNITVGGTITAGSGPTTITNAAGNLLGTALTNTSVDLTTKVTGVLPISNGGTGSNTQNFVDLTTAQAAIGGNKTFTGATTLNKLNVATGAAGIAGTATLVAGQVTVNTTAVTAGSVIMVCYKGAPTGVAGNLYTDTITAGTSFIIHSTSGADTSTVNWWVLN
jgi:hypothetical protein